VTFSYEPGTSHLRELATVEYAILPITSVVAALVSMASRIPLASRCICVGEQVQEVGDLARFLRVTALADRAAARVSLDDPGGVARLLNSLMVAGAERQFDVLAERLPAAGLFGIFLEQEDRQDRFRLGREADGNPARPWEWKIWTDVAGSNTCSQLVSRKGIVHRTLQGVTIAKIVGAAHGVSVRVYG
jgi:hypothetical protein